MNDREIRKRINFPFVCSCNERNTAAFLAEQNVFHLKDLISGGPASVNMCSNYDVMSREFPQDEFNFKD